MKTAQDIIDDMTDRVERSIAVSPASWVESAMRVNLLMMETDSKLAVIEALMNDIEAEYVKQDMPSSKAKTLARAEVDYEMYLKMKAKVKRVAEWSMLAKKRASVQDL